MYLHPGEELVYLAHPRTASEATARALVEQAGFHKVGRHHGSIQDYAKHLEPVPDDSWEIMAVVRNPFDVFISWCFYKTFDLELGVEYLRAVRRTTQEWIRGHRLFFHREEANTILRYEELPGVLNEWLAEAGLGPVEPPRVNVSEARQGRPYWEFYTPEMRAWVEGHCWKELQELDYAFEERRTPREATA